MADIGEALSSILTGDSTVSNLVSARVYPHQLPQSPTYPAVTYQLVSLDERPHAMGDDPALVMDRYQVDCWAQSYSKMVELGDAVMGALSRYRGTSSSVTIQSVLHVGRIDLFEDDTRIYHRAIDFRIAWEE
jgi:hypothetical protein